MEFIINAFRFRDLCESVQSKLCKEVAVIQTPVTMEAMHSAIASIVSKLSEQYCYSCNYDDAFRIMPEPSGNLAITIKSYEALDDCNDWVYLASETFGVTVIKGIYITPTAIRINTDYATSKYLKDFWKTINIHLKELQKRWFKELNRLRLAPTKISAAQRKTTIKKLSRLWFTASGEVISKSLLQGERPEKELSGGRWNAVSNL